MVPAQRRNKSKKRRKKKHLNSCFVADPLMVFSFQGYLPLANLYSLLEYVHQYREDLAFRWRCHKNFQHLSTHLNIDYHYQYGGDHRTEEIHRWRLWAIIRYIIMERTVRQKEDCQRCESPVQQAEKEDFLVEQ